MINILMDIILPWFLIEETFSLVIPQDISLVILFLNIVWKDRNFPASSRGIDHQVRNGITGSKSTQSPDNIKPFSTGVLKCADPGMGSH